ncbi:MAG: DUF4031 domain-containing protein [Rhizomicrobium sp.]
MRGGLSYVCDNRRHLICVPYSVLNLHEMARQLDIKRCWFHAGRHPHYDIPKGREDEIMARCVVVSPKEITRTIQAAMPDLFAKATT